MLFKYCSKHSVPVQRHETLKKFFSGKKKCQELLLKEVSCAGILIKSSYCIQIKLVTLKSGLKKQPSGRKKSKKNKMSPV